MPIYLIYNSKEKKPLLNSSKLKKFLFLPLLKIGNTSLNCELRVKILIYSKLNNRKCDYLVISTKVRNIK